MSGALDPQHGLGPDLALSSCPSPCVSASTHQDEILCMYPTQCAPLLFLLSPRTRQSKEADLRLGVGQGGRIPHRGSFSRGAGCRGADLEVSRACGRVVGVTWQGGAGAHGAAGEGLPRGLWDRARVGEEAATGQRARVGEGVCWTSHPQCAPARPPPHPELRAGLSGEGMGTPPPALSPGI